MNSPTAYESSLVAGLFAALGATEVGVDLKSALAFVKFDPDKTRPDQLTQAVSDVGFPAALKK